MFFPRDMQLCLVLLILLVDCANSRLLLPHYFRDRRFRWHRAHVGRPEPRPNRWALLVAGTSGWSSYRHQADVCRVYHMLRENGIPARQIITMMFDDIANHTRNPNPGKVLNGPNGADIHANVIVNYKGSDVNPSNFLAVLEGNAGLVRGGDGRVIKSNRHDNIFVYAATDGGFGISGFPYDILTAKDLKSTLMNMHSNQRYKQLVFYIDSSESGSMFNRVVPDNIDVYAITATNDKESNWATQCGDSLDQTLCMANEFTTAWLRQCAKNQIPSQTLHDQFRAIGHEVSVHPSEYGNKTMARQLVSQFQGECMMKESQSEVPKLQKLPAKNMHLSSLHEKMRSSETRNGKLGFRQKISRFIQRRNYMKNVIIGLVDELIHDPGRRRLAFEHRPETFSKLECFDAVVKTFHEECFHFNRNAHAFSYAYVFANLCESGTATNTILRQLRLQCAEVDVTNIH